MIYEGKPAGEPDQNKNSEKSLVRNNIKALEIELERKKDLYRLSQLRPIDDEFMRCIFRDNIPLVQHVLRVITKIHDLQIISVETQADMKRLVGARSICLDAYGTDGSGRKYDIEIQRASRGAGVHRARFHASVLDVENLDAGQDFDELPETYTIFITQHDVFGRGDAIYPIERMNLATGELFGDGEHILYVNGSYRGDDEVGWLMHDFSCADPDKMINEDIAEISRYYKGTKKGVEYMSDILEEMKNEVAERVRREVTEEVTREVTEEVTETVGAKTYIAACREFGILDPEELHKRVMQKFDSLTEEKAREYVRQAAQ